MRSSRLFSRFPAAALTLVALVTAFTLVRGGTNEVHAFKSIGQVCADNGYAANGVVQDGVLYCEQPGEITFLNSTGLPGLVALPHIDFVPGTFGLTPAEVATFTAADPKVKCAAAMVKVFKEVFKQSGGEVSSDFNKAVEDAVIQCANVDPTLAEKIKPLKNGADCIRNMGKQVREFIEKKSTGKLLLDSLKAVNECLGFAVTAGNLEGLEVVVDASGCIAQFGGYFVTEGASLYKDFQSMGQAAMTQIISGSPLITALMEAFNDNYKACIATTTRIFNAIEDGYKRVLESLRETAGVITLELCFKYPGLGYYFPNVCPNALDPDNQEFFRFPRLP